MFVPMWVVVVFVCALALYLAPLLIELAIIVAMVAFAVVIGGPLLAIGVVFSLWERFEALVRRVDRIVPGRRAMSPERVWWRRALETVYVYFGGLVWGGAVFILTLTLRIWPMDRAVALKLLLLGIIVAYPISLRFVWSEKAANEWRVARDPKAR